MSKFFLFVIISCIFLPACVSQNAHIIQRHEIVELNDQPNSEAYIFAAGDKLSVKFFFNKDLNEDVVIRSDGKISLQLIDDVQAAGLTPDELDAVLTKAYAKSFKTNSNKYVLAVADQISIESYYHEKLNDKVIVRPDGKISLRLIGEVQASGHTPSELNALITEKYSHFFESPDFSINVLSFNRPDLTVIVRETSDQKVYIGGEVTKPGIIKIAGEVRMLDAIIQAAGPLESGNLSDVILIRHGSKNEPQIYNVNVKDVLLGVKPDISLKPYDIVYVPKTAVADVNKFVKTHLFDFLPNQVMFSFLYNWNNEVQVKSK